MPLYRLSTRALPLLFCLMVAACGGREGAPLYMGPPCLDALVLPQDLSAYAVDADAQRPLLSFAEQALAAARQKENLTRPWRATQPGNWVKQSLDKNWNMSLAKAYTESEAPFPPDAWRALEKNCNKAAYPLAAGPGILLRHTNLRAMPGFMPYYLRPELPGEGYPFDYFQHTSVPMGTPVYICHISLDGRWTLVESAMTVGWVPSWDVAPVDKMFMERWQAPALAAITHDYSRIGELVAHTGTLLPLASEGARGFDQAVSVYYPLRDSSGKARIAKTVLLPGAAVPVPLPLTAANVARIGNDMMGQAYGWGGIDEKRDCSALTRDLFAPFGLYLPRNSARQAETGSVIPLSGMSNKEKEAVIIRGGAPFHSLVWMPGHIMVYLGVHQGRAIVFHNMWGLRIKDATIGCDGRAVVGKAVVTTLQPGIERPDLCFPGSFLDRVEKMTVLGKEDTKEALSIFR